MTVLALVPSGASADVLIDSFERDTNEAWFFYGEGSATGSVGIGDGYSGRGGVLSYDLSEGGPYASAIANVSVPEGTITAAISLWLRSPANISIRLRVFDDSGQAFQYVLYRPFTATDPDAWYQQIVALDAPNQNWGGAGDGKVHHPIRRIDILAAEPFEPGPRDSVGFDEIVSLSSIDYTLDPAARVTPGPRQSGDLPSHMGVSIHPDNFDANSIAAASSAGFAFVRTDLFWSDVEPGPTEGAYDWTNYDNLLAKLRSQSPSMNALFILDFGNQLYTGAFENPPTTPEAVAAFGNFAEAAARHFAGTGVRFEVWNEPDGDDHHLEPDQYAVLAKEAVARVHQGDPEAQVSTAGVIGFHYSYIRDFLSQQRGIEADGIGVHPYDVGNPGGDLVNKIVLLRDILPEYFTSPPVVWQTEWGFSSSQIPEDGSDGHAPGARYRQAVLTARELLSSHAVGFPLFVYYDLRDDGTIPTYSQHNYGLLTTDNSDKPAMTAVKTLTRFTRGRTFRGFLATSTTSLAALRFDNTSNKVFVLWVSAPQLSVPITIPAGATVADLFGSPVQVNNQRLLLTEADGPVYITTQ